MIKDIKKLSDFTKKKFNELTDQELYDFIGTHKTDQSGVPKPMLAQQSDKCSPNVFEKDHYCSRKLDGVRCLMYYKDGEVLSASRGGTDYNIPTTLIRENEKLKQYFEQNPTIILDGELYSHGQSLQKIIRSCSIKRMGRKM